MIISQRDHFESFKKAFVNSSAHLTVSMAFSLPINHAAMIKYAYLFAEDVWLYNYDRVHYEGLL